MSLRMLRHRLTPHWLRTEERRRWRDILFRHCGIERSYAPPLIVRQPELAVRSCLPFVLAQELLANPQLTFLQIGAFDGVTDDDLHELIIAHKLRGVLVEPQSEAFARLRQTYRDHTQLTLLDAAIAEEEGIRTLYSPRGAASLLASFEYGHLRRHGVPGSQITARPVNCLTVEGAMRAAGLERIDFIQVDAEGYDWPIIRSIDFARLQPRILRFEYRNMRPVEADACLALLAAHGYRFIVEPRDIIAHRSEAAVAASSVAPATVK